ncbi:helix-turn-helix transcriptional regulator [Caballeronia sp. LZ032]|uniref:helix-turn-helix domain-containing protein n=1 Tax=Caballeronia sp. LZ032 TaxID=3038565 RepID=UPI00285F4B0D|nr:helix-turn-helix transcriptional regulator [Caballeronia sp. LZ032]MDR5882607.1 helix-turn-helix transcriptional regulator [Caballeronia sp. LZ032]
MNSTLVHALADPASSAPDATVGALLREWRQRRRMSQLDLAGEADVSTRHLSFVESGRALPSREMVMRLAEQLDVPLRERNTLLMAAGYAPLYRERALADPHMASARRAVELVLKGHEPFPALAIDRHWNIVAANAALPPLIVSADAALLAPPVNALRLSMHPRGLAGVIDNWHEWRAHLLARLHRQVEVSGDPVLLALHAELEAYPAPAHAHAPPSRRHEPDPVVVPLRLRTPHGMLSFFSTTTVFGTPVDITLSELAIEALFPADDVTAAILGRLAEARC